MRPLRIGILAEGATHGQELLDVLSAPCSWWGGVLSALLPCQDGQLDCDWLSFLEWHDPDALACSPDPSAYQPALKALPRRYRPLQVTTLTHLLEQEHYPNRSPLGYRGALNEFLGPPAQTTVVWPDLSAAGHAAALLVAAYGSPPDKWGVDRLTGAGHPPRQELQAALEDPGAAPSSPTYLDACGSGVTVHIGTPARVSPFTTFFRPASVGIVLTDDEPAFRDIAWFWRLRLRLQPTGTEVRILPRSVLLAHLGEWAAWAQDVRQKRPPSGSWLHAVHVVAPTLGLGVAKECAEALSQQKPGGDPLPCFGGEGEPGSQPATLVAIGRSVTADTVAIGDEFSVPTIAPYQARHYRPPFGGCWALDLGVKDVQGGRQGLRVPPLPGLAEELAPDMWEQTQQGVQSQTRISLAGHLVVEFSGVGDRLRVRLPARRLLLDATYGHVGPHRAHGTGEPIRPELSDHGGYAIGLVSLLGGLEPAATILREPGVQWLLRYLSGKRNRPYRRQWLVRGMEEAGTAGAPDQVFAALLSHRILLRGVFQRCVHCQYRFWASTADLRDELTCPGCGSLTALEEEPTWQYRLNELAASAYEQGQVPAVLAADVYLAEAEDAFYWCPETRLHDTTTGAATSDVDVTIWVDGRLVVGEVKTSGDELGMRDVERLRALVQQHPLTEVLIAYTCSEVGPKVRVELDALKAEAESYGVEFTELTWPNLYSRTRKLKSAASDYPAPQLRGLAPK